MNKTKRILLISIGTFFIGIGIIGIFIPILPTTPFILIAATLYARSSKNFYNRLINNKIFGKYIRNYREGKGIPLTIKILTVAFLWITIGCSTFFAVKILIVRIILVLIAIGVTVHIVQIKTFKG
jgi:uncharacterized membrane protein YbaN (DUF454 family)